MQSPWEATRAPSAWTDLLSAGGFGIALPLHAVLARNVAQAIRSSRVPTLFVNACYPDAVNPLLHAEGLPVFCGVGNSATLAASLRAVLRPQAGERLRVLAHHAHLHAPADPADEARVWLDDRPVPHVGELLTAHRACSREELNAVTGHTAAVLAARLAAEQEVHADLPGPLGLPGGYPSVSPAAASASTCLLVSPRTKRWRGRPGWPHTTVSRSVRPARSASAHGPTRPWPPVCRTWPKPVTPGTSHP
ncbi:hypothetical protein O1M54_48450 [Streptomyces diastatochromogenes]|nr:hypothetical protein [Streptomyces diastatochromogenes]